MTSISGISNVNTYNSAMKPATHQYDLRGALLQVGDYVSFMVVTDPNWVYGKITGVYHRFVAVQVIGFDTYLSIDPKTLIKVNDNPTLTEYLLKV